jgi:murein DD-endopeptidase MepM/ murein hydrolase activator NlpD
MTYGVLRYHPAAFDSTENPTTPEDAFDRSIEQYTFLKQNAAVIAVSSNGLGLMPVMNFADSNYTPSIWPVMGHITDAFGERLDPFSGEGAFHTGVDVASDYGAPVHATADGIVTIAENHSGYGRLVVLDHGFGITTWYAHLSSFSAVPGTRIKRGEVIGYTGISGRSTGPHVHYEVRVNNAPVNPWRYMKGSGTAVGD